jgi:hypothetical protein
MGVERRRRPRKALAHPAALKLWGRPPGRSTRGRRIAEKPNPNMPAANSSFKRTAARHRYSLWRSHSAIAARAIFKRRKVSGVCGFQLLQRVRFFWKNARAQT